MYVAVVSPDRQRARRLGEQILDACMSNGCYSTFLYYQTDSAFLDELKRREIGTVIIAAEGEPELALAKDLSRRCPEVKLILLGSNETAVEGYAFQAHYCTRVTPGKREMEEIAQVIFSECSL